MTDPYLGRVKAERVLWRRPSCELDRLKHRREAWRAVGPGYPEWLRDAKAATLAKLDAEIHRLEREGRSS